MYNPLPILFAFMGRCLLRNTLLSFGNRKILTLAAEWVNLFNHRQLNVTLEVAVPLMKGIGYLTLNGRLLLVCHAATLDDVQQFALEVAEDGVAS
jgi:hypothetical protein